VPKALFAQVSQVTKGCFYALEATEQSERTTIRMTPAEPSDQRFDCERRPNRANNASNDTGRTEKTTIRLSRTERTTIRLRTMADPSKQRFDRERRPNRSEPSEQRFEAKHSEQRYCELPEMNEQTTNDKTANEDTPDCN
jgi:hypothetical protein